MENTWRKGGQLHKVIDSNNKPARSYTPTSPISQLPDSFTPPDSLHYYYHFLTRNNKSRSDICLLLLIFTSIPLLACFVFPPFRIGTGQCLSVRLFSFLYAAWKFFDYSNKQLSISVSHSLFYNLLNQHICRECAFRTRLCSCVVFHTFHRCYVAPAPPANSHPIPFTTWFSFYFLI